MLPLYHTQKFYFYNYIANDRFPYHYLVTTSPKYKATRAQIFKDMKKFKVIKLLNNKFFVYHSLNASVCGAKANSLGVTGGLYKDQVNIHRGVLIRDY